MVEVTDKGVAIRKRMGGGVSETTLTAPAGQVSLRVEGDLFVVKTPAGEVRGDLARRETLLPVTTALKKASTAVVALRLLDRMTLNPNSVPGHALLLTRAMLQSLHGNDAGTAALAGWAKKRATQISVVRARQDSDKDGPDYCWNTYVISAIKIWDEYVDCLSRCAWWDIPANFACGFIYDLRAEGAFAWWLKCTAIRTE